jgi:hypothetical protein
MFFIAALGGGALIVYSKELIPELATFGPSASVVLFALIVAVAQKAGADGEIFGITMPTPSTSWDSSSLWCPWPPCSIAWAKADWEDHWLPRRSVMRPWTAAPSSHSWSPQRMALSTRMLEETFSLIGVAVTTSIAGVLMRNMVRSWFLKNHSGGNGDMEQAVAELKKRFAEGMSGGFADSMQAIGDYFEERKDLAGQIKRKEKAYLSGLENFTESMDRFAGRLNEVEKNLAGSSESHGGQPEKSRPKVSVKLIRAYGPWRPSSRI